MARHPTVLVVDDEPDIAALLVALLESEGYSAARAASGREALELVPMLRPAAIVLDLSLPDLDGMHVLRLLKDQQETAGIPVIVVSAYTGRLTIADKALVHAVLEKPFDLEQLASVLARLFSDRQSVPVASHRRRAHRPAVTAA